MSEPIGATGNGATFFKDDERPRSATHGTSLTFGTPDPRPTVPRGGVRPRVTHP